MGTISHKISQHSKTPTNLLLLQTAVSQQISPPKKFTSQRYTLAMTCLHGYINSIVSAIHNIPVSEWVDISPKSYTNCIMSTMSYKDLQGSKAPKNFVKQHCKLLRAAVTQDSLERPLHKLYHDSQ